ncbi:MAG: phosphoribosylglycinamide formyltransferase-1 [Candidatus Azotimanducaceae bacterium]|jgi:phosphoribosylglycinamide formyltransferase-1
MTRLGILASHRGSNFQAIIDACERGQINAKPVLAISNNSQSMALTRARQAGIKALHISGVTHPEDHDQAIADALTEQAIDLVITAGYMKKLGPVTLARFAGKIINVHPSLLPRHGGPGMYGLKVHQAVIDAGDHETGISIHRVESDYDSGPVIAQVRIPVASDDTAVSLAQKVIQREHALLVSTLASLISLNPTETCR